MKKTSPPPVPVRPAFWRPLGLFSLLVNIGLAVWLWRAPVHPVIPPQLATAALPAGPGKTRPRELTPYAGLGSFMAENNRIPDLKWTEPQFVAFIDGFRASYEGRGLPLDDDAKRLRDEISRKVQSMLAAEQPNPMEEYFHALRDKEGVLKTSSGLHYRITESGDGPTPQPSDSVVISFAGRLPDGKTLPPLTRARVKMVVRDLLPGLAEGVQFLRVGGKALVYLPPDLAFTEKNWPPQLPKGTPLVFFLELHEISPAMQ
jgi:FKBP-type peptidyl-prolyl cis-trans isomerase